MPPRPPQHPDWDRLYETAAAQEGLFTTRQAAEAGYSPQLLIHHVAGGRVARVRRGIYRLVHFPVGEHAELAGVWLWSEREGVFSHQTALALHGLSDAMPAQVHLTLPSAWRFRAASAYPAGSSSIMPTSPRKSERWFGPVPITPSAHAWTLNDCARDGLSPELLQQATKQALRRGLVVRAELPDVKASLKAFGGLPA